LCGLTLRIIARERGSAEEGLQALILDHRISPRFSPGSSPPPVLKIESARSGDRNDQFSIGGVAQWQVQQSGPFWQEDASGTCRIWFAATPWVVSTRVGYTGGEVPNAAYRNHGNHAEAIEITFDPAKISYRTLLEFFFQLHDLATRNRHDNDVGASCRSANLLHQ
jgi:hypothetical protein